MIPEVARVKVEKNLKEAIAQVVDLIGGFEKFIKRGETVLLKPNFNTADPFPASSDLEFLKAVIELIYECQPKIVMIGESSTMSLNTRKIMEKLDVFELEKMDPPARVYVFDEYKWIKKEIPQDKYLKEVFLTEFFRTSR